MADATPSTPEPMDVEKEESGHDVDPPSENPPVLKKPAAKTAAKGKAKAKAKNLPKATPKVEPKAAPTTSKALKVLMKKPATAKPKAVKKAMMKKPASAMHASKGGSSWSVGSKGLEAMQTGEKDHGEQGEEEVQEEDEIMEVPEDKFGMDQKTKDRSKDFKFKTLLTQGSLPAWLKTAWQKTTTMKSGRLAEQRRLVNLALDRKPDGALVLSLEKPQLQDLKDICLPVVTCELPRDDEVDICFTFT